MRLREYMAASVLIAVAAAGCGNAADSHATLRVKEASGGGSAAPIAQAKGKSVVPGSPNLELVVSPTSGSPGTIVHIKATGCVDANGLNHAVSYNVSRTRITPGKSNPVRAIASTLSGTSLTASYTIRNADLRGHATHGMFYVQCGSSVVNAPFSVTQ
jgi:hypothetical protein